MDYSFAPALGFFSTGASFSVAIMIIIALEREYAEAVFWAVLVGLLLDYVSHGFFGMNIFLLVGTVWILDFVGSKFLTARISTSVIAFLLFIFTLFYEVARSAFAEAFVLAGLYSSDLQKMDEFVWQLILIKFCAVVFGLLFFFLYQTIKKFWGMEKMEIKI